MAEEQVAEPTLTDAIFRFNRRKDVLNVDQAEMQTEETMRMLLSGLDIDFDELLDLRRDLVLAPLHAMYNAGQPLAQILVGQWVDGMATGLMLAELRREREARSGEG